MRIGELARHSGCSVETIRYYEAEGLLAAVRRSASGYRDYQPADSERLIFIRHCRALGMTLAEIRQLLSARDQPQSSCALVNQLLDEQLAKVEEQLVALTSLRQLLQQLRSSCNTTASSASCGILQQLAAGSSAPAATNGNPS